jgi:chemotaxis protein CheC
MEQIPEGGGKLPKFAENILRNMWTATSNKVVVALSQMINKEVKINSPSTKILLLNDVPKLMNPKEITTTLIYTKLEGEIKGVVVVSSTLRNILKIVDLFLHKEIGYYKDLSDENISVIKEFGNILAEYYVDGLNKLFETEYKFDPPVLSVNPYRAIEDFDFGNLYRKEIYSLIFQARFDIHEESILEDVFLLFKKEDIDSIVELVSKNVRLNI